MTYEFEFGVGASVNVKALSVPAIVDAAMYTTGGSEYRVVYWWDGGRRSQWVYASELEVRQ